MFSKVQLGFHGKKMTFVFIGGIYLSIEIIFHYEIMYICLHDDKKCHHVYIYT